MRSLTEGGITMSRTCSCILFAVIGLCGYWLCSLHSCFICGLRRRSLLVQILLSFTLNLKSNTSRRILDKDFDDPVQLVYNEQLKYESEKKTEQIICTYNPPLMDENMRKISVEQWTAFVICQQCH